jgi:hypothetical protein
LRSLPWLVVRLLARARQRKEAWSRHQRAQSRVRALAPTRSPPMTPTARYRAAAAPIAGAAAQQPCLLNEPPPRPMELKDLTQGRRALAHSNLAAPGKRGPLSFSAPVSLRERTRPGLRRRRLPAPAGCTKSSMTAFASWSADHSPITRRVCSIRISSAILVRDSRTSSANAAFGRHDRQDRAGMRLVTAASR